MRDIDFNGHVPTEHTPGAPLRDRLRWAGYCALAFVAAEAAIWGIWLVWR